MSVRETVNQNPTAVTVATVLIIAAVVITMWWQTSSVPPLPRIDNSVSRAFFTTDDGATYFADDAKKIPPFALGDQIAVRCQVFASESGNEKPFVGYLERYRPEQREELQAMVVSKDPIDQGKLASVRSAGLEVKAPKSPTTSWMLLKEPAGAALVDSIVNRHDEAGHGVYRANP